MLLVRPGEPRSVWRKHAPEALPGAIDYAAVAEVIARHVAPGGTGSPGDTGTGSPGGASFVETVRRALDGTSLSPTTLDLFIDAFSLSYRNAARLQDLLSGSASVRVITGDALPPAEVIRLGGPPRHETLAVHELHTLGPDGLPAEHQTIQAVKSTVDGFDSYPYRFDTDQLAVEVVRGGVVGKTVYRVTDTLYGVDILLDRPLAAGETTLMHFRTTFLYQTPPPPEFRRVVMGSMSDVTLWVRFHPDKLPARVWWARWDRVDHATILEQRQVELEDDFSVQVRYDTVERAIVGFHWSWD